MDEKTVTKWTISKQREYDERQEMIDFDSEPSLKRYLESQINEPPTILILIRSDGGNLHFAVGGLLAGLLCFPNSNSDESFYAKPSMAYSDTVGIFTREGIATGFPAKCLMPVKDVIQLICNLYAKRSLVHSVKWVKGWDDDVPTGEAIMSESLNAQESKQKDIPF